jgi:maltooligosyltrehalose trehalohydrolase
VILDVVYNHLGPDGNYLGVYGPYFTDRYRTPWGEAVNVDGPWSDQVRDFFVDNALHWLETYGVDGLRLDAVHAITDQSAYPFLEHLSGVVDALDAATGRRSVLVAEDNRNDARMVRPVGRGGMGLEAMWADDLHHGLHVALTGETDGYYCDYRGMEDVAVALRQGYVFDGSRYSPYRRRTPGRPPGGLPPHSLVVGLQNHDQVGNRARGDRITDLVDHDRVRGAAALVLLAPQVPMIFQGEEWAASTPFQYFTDHQDPELGRAVSAGRADEFASFTWQGEVPDPQAEETFRRSRLRWEELEQAPHAAMLDWYRRLVALRATPGLSTWPEVSSGEGWLVMDRGALVVGVNLGRRGVTAAIDGPLAEVMSAGGATLHQPGSLDLPPESVAVLGRS